MKKSNVKFVSLVSLISVLALSVTGTFAWFYMNSDVEVDYGSEIVCETGSSLEISMLQGTDDNGEQVWSEFSTSIKREGLSAKLQDVSGDGLHLYTPSTLANIDGVLTPTKFAKSKPMDEDGYGDYIELELKLRSTSPMNVYFADESFILPIEVEEITNVFGDFTQNYIAGAMRLAVIEKIDDSNQELKMIWAPNANYELKRDSKGQYSFTEEGNVEQYKYYRCIDEENEKYELYNVTADDVVANKFVVNSTKTNDVMVNNSPILTTLTPDSTGYGLAHLIVRVWFEGTDRESDQALSGGHCKMKFLFSGMESKAEALDTEKAKIDAINYELHSNTVDEVTSYSITFNNVSENTSFSVDGYTWEKYQDNIPNLYQQVMESKQSTAIYFKVDETLYNYAYIRKIEIPYSEGGAN